MLLSREIGKLYSVILNVFRLQAQAPCFGYAICSERIRSRYDIMSARSREDAAVNVRKSTLLIVLGLFCAAQASAATCEGLASLSLPHTTFTLVQPVEAGALTLLGGRGPNPNAAYKDLPSFCRVAATLKPTSDSDIKIEVWLPDRWNGKFQAVGNGGWAGVISYRELSEALRAFYATASTDTGHEGGRGQFAYGHPEKLLDFGWRSEHEMTLQAKAIIGAFYG